MVKKYFVIPIFTDLSTSELVCGVDIPRAGRLSRLNPAAPNYWYPCKLMTIINLDIPLSIKCRMAPPFLYQIDVRKRLDVPVWTGRCKEGCVRNFGRNFYYRTTYRTVLSRLIYAGCSRPCPHSIPSTGCVQLRS